jgi:hypothetical protein
MSQLRKCLKDNIDVDEKFFCDGCVFHKRNPFKGMFFYECEFNEWEPGLKKDKLNANKF